MVLPKCTSEALSQGRHGSYAMSVVCFSWFLQMLRLCIITKMPLSHKMVS